MKLLGEDTPTSVRGGILAGVVTGVVLFGINYFVVSKPAENTANKSDKRSQRALVVAEAKNDNEHAIQLRGVVKYDITVIRKIVPRASANRTFMEAVARYGKANGILDEATPDYPTASRDYAQARKLLVAVDAREIASATKTCADCGSTEPQPLLLERVAAPTERQLERELEVLRRKKHNRR